MRKKLKKKKRKIQNSGRFYLLAINKEEIGKKRSFPGNREDLSVMCKNKAKLENIPKSKKALQHGKSPYLEIENALHDWVVEC